ncbi:MAG: 1-acyl-sn-glycerol-3-phosphate acyltransferase [Actinobacteria bacterium]|nr:1-acyl-sn-glycerol-3-phosphate acyltransferase [Actinomycetota bacterium]
MSDDVSAEGPSAAPPPQGAQAAKAIGRRDQIGAGFRFASWVVPPIYSMFSYRDYHGGENLNQPGGLVVASNHISWADPLAIARFLWDNNRVARFLVKDSVARAPVLGTIVNSAKQIPVERGTSRAGLAAVEAVKAVKAGETVLVYPEGTITKDPNLWPMEGRSGAVRIAVESGAPLVPMAIWGPQEILAPYSGKPNLFPRKKISAIAGPPLDIDYLRTGTPTQEQYREAANNLMDEITRLLEILRKEPRPERS